MATMSFRIRRARSIGALSQSELARRVGVKRSAVGQWERVDGTSPSVEHLTQIARETGVNFEWIATGRGACHPSDGAFEHATAMHDYAHDDLESRMLNAMRRLSNRKQQALVQIVELLTH